MEQHYPLFCGIDIGKAKHAACVIDAAGNLLMPSRNFNNDHAGFVLLRQRLDDLRQGRPLLIGMEATGHYWYALHEYLRTALPGQEGYEAVVLNPLQTAQHASKQIRKNKTDKIDAHRIATVIKNGDYRRSIIPGERASTCRQLTRLWFALTCQRTRVKQLILSTLEWRWPEFEAYFSDPLCATARAVLGVAPSPQCLSALDATALTQLIEKASRGRLGAELARRMLDSSRLSVGMRRGAQGADDAIAVLLMQLDSGKQVRKHLQEKIEALAGELPAYLLTLPGAGHVSAVSLFAETDPISAFGSPDQLVAFAGLDPIVFQTGQYDAPRRRISKRGSPHLRRTLWLMASAAILRPGPFRDDYKRRRAAGAHHLSAVTAISLKLCRIAWRIMTDQRPYTPQPPAAKQTKGKKESQ